jgi:hypothetical protein
MGTLPAYFPRTAQEIDAWGRTRTLTLVDEVHLAHKELLVEDPDYAFLITAFRDEDAVEGGLKWDNWEGARLVRDYGKRHEARFPLLAAAKMPELHRAYLWAKRRSGMTRDDMAKRFAAAGGVV